MNLTPVFRVTSVLHWILASASYEFLKKITLGITFWSEMTPVMPSLQKHVISNVRNIIVICYFLCMSRGELRLALFPVNYSKGIGNEAGQSRLLWLPAFRLSTRCLPLCWSSEGFMHCMHSLSNWQLSNLSPFHHFPIERRFLSVSGVEFVSLTVNHGTAFHRRDWPVSHALTHLIHLSLACWICKWSEAGSHNLSAVMATM